MRKLFIVGMVRSGTTLLNQIMDSHPDVVMLPTIDWMGIGFTEIFSPQWKVKRSDLRIGGHQYAKVLAAFMDKLFEEYFNARTAREPEITSRPIFMGTKLMWVWNEVRPIIDLAYPDLVWLFIIRNPYDTLASIRRQSWGDWKIADFVKEWLRITSWVETVASRQRMIIKYEDLVLDPNAKCIEIASFLGLKSSLMMVHPSLKPHDDGLDVRTYSHLQPHTNPIQKDAIGCAKSELTIAELRYIRRSDAGRLAARLGYERPM